jgi:hypothetical protein
MMAKKKPIEWAANISAEALSKSYTAAKALSIGRKAVNWLLSVRLNGKLSQEEISPLEDLTFAYLTLYLVGCNNTLALASIDAERKGSIRKHQEAVTNLLLKLMLPNSEMSTQKEIEYQLEVLEQSIEELSAKNVENPPRNLEKVIIEMFKYTPPSDQETLAESEKLLNALEEATPIQKQLRKVFAAPPEERQKVLDQLVAAVQR